MIQVGVIEKALRESKDGFVTQVGVLRDCLNKDPFHVDVEFL